MSFLRRRDFTLLLIAGATRVAYADAFPAKPVRWIVGYSAGGGSDFVARTVGQAWQEQLGQTVLVDNKPGANSAIGATEVARAAPDGYTVGFVDNSTMVLNTMLYKKLSYDPQKEFTGITLIGRMPGVVVVNPAWGVNTMQEYVKRAKEKPKTILFGSPGAGNVFHLGMELFNATAGIEATHSPYRGAAPALQDLIAGNIQSMMVDLAASAPFITSGKLKPLAVANATRLQGLPNVPTLAEVGYPGFEVAALQGAVVPTGTPPDVVAQLNKTMVAAVKSPAVTKKLLDFGYEPAGSTAKVFTDTMAADRARWSKIVGDLKISLD